jgi:hypothetical protein
MHIVEGILPNIAEGCSRPYLAALSSYGENRLFVFANPGKRELDTYLSFGLECKILSALISSRLWD